MASNGFVAAVARPAASVAEKKLIDIVDGAELAVVDACGVDWACVGVSLDAEVARDAAVGTADDDDGDAAAARPRTSLLHS